MHRILQQSFFALMLPSYALCVIAVIIPVCVVMLFDFICSFLVKGLYIPIIADEVLLLQEYEKDKIQPFDRNFVNAIGSASPRNWHNVW